MYNLQAMLARGPKTEPIVYCSLQHQEALSIIAYHVLDRIGKLKYCGTACDNMRLNEYVGTVGWGM